MVLLAILNIGIEYFLKNEKFSNFIIYYSTEFKICIQNLLNILFNLDFDFFTKSYNKGKKCVLQMFR
nr:hypothetical protein [Borreliella garinii]